MPLLPCLTCGGREFRGSLEVFFFDLPITLDADGERSADWSNAPSGADRIVSATCTKCGEQQIDVADEL